MIRRHDSFVVEVTRRCQHACPHCYNVWKGPRGYADGAELGTSELLALLDRLVAETGATAITLTGGEPLLRPDLPALVGHLAGRGLAVNLITNGTLLDEAHIAALAGHVAIFELPLLSADRAIHDRLSGLPGAFDRVTLAMARLRAARQRVVGVFVATRLNLPTWRDTAELAFALGLDGVMFNRFNPGGAGLAHIPELQADPEELAAALDVAAELQALYEFSIAVSIPMPACLFDPARWPTLHFGTCAAGTPRAYYTIDPSGRLRPCNHSPTILGDLRTAGFWELVDGPAMRRFVAARPAFCRGCAIEDTCLGGCKAAAEVACGALDACDPFLGAFSARARRPGDA